MTLHWTSPSSTIPFLCSGAHSSTVWPHQGCVQGQHHIPPHTQTILLLNLAQNTSSLPYHKCTLLSPVQAGVLFCPNPVAFSWVAPSIHWCLSLFLPSFRTLHFSLLNCMILLASHCSSLLRSLWTAYTAQHTSQFFPSANSLRIHSAPSSGWLTKVLNRTGPTADHWGTLWVADL